MRPLILVTNDDGIGAAGIGALIRAMESLGDVAVCAPDRERSGVSHAITLGRPLRARSAGDRRWAVDGTPTDCVYLAVNHLLQGAEPTLVVSGINHGPNLAEDVTYSGTVAGAMEGTLMGIPSIAVSLDGREPYDFGPAAAFAASVATWVLAHGLPARTLLNVNVPDTRGDAVAGYRWTRGGRRDYRHQVLEQVDPMGRPFYWIGGVLGTLPVEQSDCDAVAAGLAAITPVHLDFTHYEVLQHLGAVDLPGFHRR